MDTQEAKATWDALTEAQRDILAKAAQEKAARTQSTIIAFDELCASGLMAVMGTGAFALITDAGRAVYEASNAPDGEDVDQIDTVLLAWFSLTPVQRETLKWIALDTALELRHQYYKPHIDVLTSQNLIRADADGYVVTKLGKRVYEAGCEATLNDEVAFLRARLAVGSDALTQAQARIRELEAERDTLRAALDWAIELAPDDVVIEGVDYVGRLIAIGKGLRRALKRADAEAGA